MFYHEENKKDCGCSVLSGHCSLSIVYRSTGGTPGQSAEVGIQPYADVIVTKYRAYQGLFQKRRWNETRGYWVDPEWITIGTQV